MCSIFFSALKETVQLFVNVVCQGKGGVSGVRWCVRGQVRSGASG